MTLRERKCPHCKLFFMHEDGIDSHGLAITRDDSELKPQQESLPAYCPRCYDPHAISGMTYYKETVLSSLRVHLEEHGINQEYLDQDSLLSLLKTFPDAQRRYNSNGTYRTFSIPPGEKLVGEYGEFMMGGCTDTTREIICCRCGNIAIYNSTNTLKYIIGLTLKRCHKCDAKHYASDHERSTEGLNRNGSSKSVFSERAIAQALNISRNDLRRHKISTREPALPIGTIVNGLRVEQAYFDEKTYSPRYLLKCDKCNEEFECLQKRVNLLQHFCAGVRS